ncbi:hypothetical protein GCM10009133_15510 [Cocleimonas flava]|uniref:Uncharacterized protein n=1 Tax=Cocleimonas flava TaxID=634765 RepID=A0A4R1EXA3_9GAMM|nr:hypothetical protein [Cocleimonas flava]TCJ84479.1 hypothetical protein EV695_2436 [Cocleimonas flava]
MFKTFTLTRKEEEQLSETEGKMTFHLTDESGFQRKVSGFTQLDENLNAVSISTPRKREHPLIQCLFITNVDETINIEFTQYNDVFERNDQDTAEKSIEELAREMQNKPVRLGPLLKSVEIKSTESIH